MCAKKPWKRLTPSARARHTTICWLGSTRSSTRRKKRQVIFPVFFTVNTFRPNKKKFSELAEIWDVRHTKKIVKKYAVLAFFAKKSSSLISRTLLVLRLGICRIIYHAITSILSSIASVTALTQALLLTTKRSFYERICTRYKAKYTLWQAWSSGIRQALKDV